MMRRFAVLTGALAPTLLCALTALGSSVSLVVPANPSGDAFTIAGSSNSSAPTGTTDWVYNNVRGHGTVGINHGYDFNANGSLQISGPAGSNYKADLEYLGGASNDLGALARGSSSTTPTYFATQAIGKLADLTALGYSWIVGSDSTTTNLHPALRLQIDADGILATTNDRGYLIFEQAYNGSNIPIGQWVTNDLYNYNSGASANMWLFLNGVHEKFDITLKEWLDGDTAVTGSDVDTSSALILGVSTGIGSGWTGKFTGAVDMIQLGFRGQTTVYDLGLDEAPLATVPEPGTAALGLIGLGALAGRFWLHRRRGNC